MTSTSAAAFTSSFANDVGAQIGGRRTPRSPPRRARRSRSPGTRWHRRERWPADSPRRSTCPPTPLPRRWRSRCSAGGQRLLRRPGPLRSGSAVVETAPELEFRLHARGMPARCDRSRPSVGVGPDRADSESGSVFALAGISWTTRWTGESERSRTHARQARNGRRVPRRDSSRILRRRRGSGPPLAPVELEALSDCHRRGLPDSVRASTGASAGCVSRRRRHAGRGNKARSRSKRPRGKLGGHDMNVDAIIRHAGWSCSRGCSSIRAASRCPWFRRWWLRARSPAGRLELCRHAGAAAGRSARRGQWSGMASTLAPAPQVLSLPPSVLTPDRGSGSITSRRIPRAMKSDSSFRKFYPQAETRCSGPGRRNRQWPPAATS